MGSRNKERRISMAKSAEEYKEVFSLFMKEGDLQRLKPDQQKVLELVVAGQEERAVALHLDITKRELQRRCRLLNNQISRLNQEKEEKAKRSQLVASHKANRASLSDIAIMGVFEYNIEENLHNAGLRTLADLQRMGATTLSTKRNIGPGTIIIIRKTLELFGEKLPD